MSYKYYMTLFAEFPAVSLLFRWGWVGGWGRWWLEKFEVETKTNLSLAGASLLGLSLAMILLGIYKV